jgi:lipopolysaccharide/colanic/teichoic acid biosynthesis glycosyltransferase
VKKLLYAVTAPISAVAFMRGQMQYMQAKDLEAHLVTANEPELAVIAERETVILHPVNMKREIDLPNDFRVLWQMLGVFWKIRPSISNVSTPKAGLLGGIAAFLTRVPARVYTLRGLRLETATGAKRVVLTVMEWIACFTAHKIVCVSPSLRQKLIEMRFATPEKAVILGGGSSNGVIAERFTPTPERLEGAKQLRLELGIPENAPVIGFVGRFTKDKGFHELVSAFATILESHPDAYLLLVGDYEAGDPVPDTVRLQLEALPHVVKAGFVADPALIYHVFTVLALPTYREGFPNVPLEAAAAGKPVVTTDATGARDAVLHEKTGLIVPTKDSFALAKALKQILQNPELATQMGQAGQAWVEHEFKPERIWQELHQLYSSLYTQRMSERQKRAAWLKRLFDVTVSGVSLVVLSPVLLGLAYLIARRLGSPVLFSQERPGLNGKPFRMYKFRSMTQARDASGELLPDSERLTQFGRWLRATSLDELPGLWNVFRGDMSLVGPRPLLMEYLEHYSLEQARRHEIKPGMTGWAQINGRNAISWEDKFKLDLWYVDNRSFLLDFQILWGTVLKVLRRDGISAAGDATMPKFTGQSEHQS